MRRCKVNLLLTQVVAGTASGHVPGLSRRNQQTAQGNQGTFVITGVRESLIGGTRVPKIPRCNCRFKTSVICLGRLTSSRGLS